MIRLEQPYVSSNYILLPCYIWPNPYLLINQEAFGNIKNRPPDWHHYFFLTVLQNLCWYSGNPTFRLWQLSIIAYRKTRFKTKYSSHQFWIHQILKVHRRLNISKLKQIYQVDSLFSKNLFSTLFIFFIYQLLWNMTWNLPSFKSICLFVNSYVFICID